ncbi:hypothetical protein SAMN05421810_101537 [Amycolatopsis arida]|uniref:Uncharacterized protein n=1 Tax=Amycolatopsis arida TaxID=587909 RepID=A0A1I5LG87_9PSEU|nr:hypothetical protein [Amycolatopsis arida]TDX93714.1 hypothetical protein CLV69_104170 [Amycolatopsis arida]SFO96384.1 hypothetical protein SAMN05421810_101537 [Amycolatopsis arida]
MAWWIWVVGVLVLLLVVAAIVDRRDARRGGTRRILMPGWLERRGRGAMGTQPVAWDAEDYRPRSPRERDEDERRRRPGH